MANRNYNPIRGPGFEITHLAGGFLPAGAAPPSISNVDGATWFTVANTGVGTYTITLQDQFVAAYAVTFGVSSLAGGTRYFARLNLPTGVSLNSLLSTTKVIPVIVTNAADAAADPVSDAANVVYFSMMMRNSSVTG